MIKKFQIINLLAILSFIIGIIIVTIFIYILNLKHSYLNIKNSYAIDNKYLAVITENEFGSKMQKMVTSIINADDLKEII